MRRTRSARTRRVHRCGPGRRHAAHDHDRLSGHDKARERQSQGARSPRPTRTYRAKSRPDRADHDLELRRTNDPLRHTGRARGIVRHRRSSGASRGGSSARSPRRSPPPHMQSAPISWIGILDISPEVPDGMRVQRGDRLAEPITNQMIAERRPRFRWLGLGKR